MPWTADNPQIDGVAWWREGTRIGIAFDYDPDAVNRIKEVPPQHRKYDPGLRCWFISNEALALDLLAELPRYVFGGEQYYEGRPAWLAARAEWITMRGWERKQKSQEERRGRRKRQGSRQQADKQNSLYELPYQLTACSIVIFAEF